jgi:hypothetical protein
LIRRLEVEKKGIKNTKYGVKTIFGVFCEGGYERWSWEYWCAEKL